jgi:hypothetical protein
MKRNYFSETLASYSGSYCINTLLNPLDLDTVLFTSELSKDILEQAKHIPTSEIDKKGWGNDHDFDHPAFTNSYLNITTETRVSQQLFTEKTAKTLAAGQLFLQVNGADSINSLRSLGLETFDNVLDNSYDLLPNFTDRIDKMFQTLDAVESDLEQIYNDNLSAIRYNQEYFLSDSFRQNMELRLRERGIIS